MRTRLLALLVVLAIALAAGWWVGHMQPQSRIDELVSQLRTESDQLEETQHRLELSQSDLEDQDAEKKKWKAKAKDLRPRLQALRLRTDHLGGLAQALAPNTGVLESSYLVRGASHDLLVVAWRVDQRQGRRLPRSGIEIWQLSERSPVDRDSSVATSWRMVYAIDPHPTVDAGYLREGPPGNQTQVDSYSSRAFLRDIGDVTGDDMPDLAIQDWGSGTGGCGIVRVLDNAASGLREIFHKDDCDHHLYFKGGSVAYRTAYSPRGCSTAHGCGWTRTWMRWNGASWDVTNVRRKLYR